MGVPGDRHPYRYPNSRQGLSVQLRILSVREFDVFIRLSLLCDPIFPGEVNRVDFTCGPGYKFGSLAAPLVEGVFLRWVEPLNQDFRFGSSDGTSLPRIFNLMYELQDHPATFSVFIDRG